MTRAAALQADNVSLYQKLKYVQGYQRDPARARKNAGMSGQNALDAYMYV